MICGGRPVRRIHFVGILVVLLVLGLVGSQLRRPAPAHFGSQPGLQGLPLHQQQQHQQQQYLYQHSVAGRHLQQPGPFETTSGVEEVQSASVAAIPGLSDNSVSSARPPAFLQASQQPLFSDNNQENNQGNINNNYQPSQVAEAQSSDPQSDLNNGFLNPVWRTEHTLDARLLLDTRRLRVELHKVRFDTGLQVDDWLWVDTPDIVNVLPQTPDGRYWLLRERRYGLRQRCLGTVGGHVGPGEDPLVAGQRELLEELGMRAARWRFLGSYRTDANRGAGVGYFFLAEDAEFVDASRTAEMERAGLLAALEPNNPVPGQPRHGEIRAAVAAPGESTTETGAAAEAEEDPYGDDIEDRQPVLLSLEGLLSRLLDNSFQEVKWSGAASLGLLRVLADRHYPGRVRDLPQNGLQGPDRPVWAQDSRP